MNVVPKIRMTVPEFIDWAMAQPRGRFELVRGQVVEMSPERLLHIAAKGYAYRALGDAIARAGLPCFAFTDGATVVIDEHTAREPDASVQCGASFDPDSTVLDAPIIVVEVVSPSSEITDTTAKLVEYFSVPSIQHYLIVDPDERRPHVVHHAREPGRSSLRTIIHEDGTITLDPPGLTIPVAALLPQVSRAQG